MICIFLKDTKYTQKKVKSRKTSINKDTSSQNIIKTKFLI